MNHLTVKNKQPTIETYSKKTKRVSGVYLCFFPVAIS